MIIGHGKTVHFVQTYIDKLIWDPHQSLPFLLIHGPSNIGKSSTIIDMLSTYPQDSVMILEDLSQDWIALSDNNDLAGQKHELTMDIKKEREVIVKLDWTRYRNYWINNLREWLSVSSWHWYKIVFIDNIDRINDSAANSLLKLLEEPMPWQLIIATTSHLDSVIETITSRAFLYLSAWPSSDQVIDYFWTINIDPKVADRSCAKIWRWIIMNQKFEEFNQIFIKLASWKVPTLFEWLVEAHAGGYLERVCDWYCMNNPQTIPLIQKLQWYLKANCNVQTVLLNFAIESVGS